MTVIPIVNGVLGSISQELVKGIGDLKIIIKIGQSTEKSPGDLRRFAVSQTVERNQSANAGMKTSQE